MPWDNEITKADLLVDQGVGSYYEVRQKLGDEALTVVGLARPVTPETTQTDLFDYYGEEFNPKNGEKGAGWFDPAKAATNARGAALMRAELEAVRARREREAS
ncbi:MAG TPA: hypothetical protein VHB51_01140 [Candidatus Saccharimonadales bacterium]|nr:hypothetical protein [Candidatus Saccharimonadales bacterium]